jgi:hypothetical protein
VKLVGRIVGRKEMGAKEKRKKSRGGVTSGVG